MKKGKGATLFLMGILIFFFAKAYLIIPVTFALNIPRTGDDALVYLWKGRLLTKQSSYMPALNDIKMQLNLPENNDPNLSRARSRVAGRTLDNTITPIHDALIAASLKIMPDIRWAYAVSELIGLILMTAGVGWFIYEISGPAIAGITLMSLSFASLPNQGIASFIPSTASLSCSLILWGYLWRSGEKFNKTITGISSLLILGLHPIAKVYLVLTPFIYWLRLNQLKAWRSPSMLRLISILGLAMTGLFIAQQILTNLHMPSLVSTGSVNLVQGFFYNMPAVLKFFNSSFVSYNILWILLIVNGLLLSSYIKFPLQLTLLMAGSIGALIISLFFNLPGYPAELFSRLWVLTFLIGSAYGAYYLISSKKISVNLSYFYAVICMGIFLLSGAWWLIKYVPDSMNGRNEIITESSIIQSFADMPKATSILYAEADISLQTALLLGAYKYGALVYPMLKGTKDLPRLIEEKRPQILIALPNSKLNSLSQARAKKFTKRIQGLSFEYVKELKIEREKGLPLDKISLNFKNVNTHAYLIWSAVGKDDRILANGKEKISNGQTMLALPAETKSLNVLLPEMPAWLNGISNSKKKLGRNWPWESGWRLSYNLRYKQKKEIFIDFSVLDILKQNNAEDLINYVNLNDPIISDEGGLIFIRTRFNQENK